MSPRSRRRVKRSVEIKCKSSAKQRGQAVGAPRISCTHPQSPHSTTTISFVVSKPLPSFRSDGETTRPFGVFGDKGFEFFNIAFPIVTFGYNFIVDCKDGSINP